MRTSIVSLSDLDLTCDPLTPDDMLPGHMRGGDNSRRMRYIRQELCNIIEYNLTPRQREYIVKHYWQDKSRSEIARERGVGPSQVTRSINTSQKIIRERLNAFMILYDRLERELLDEPPDSDC